MSYLVLARKYRPQSFQELLGQEHITQTLKNAFQQNRIGHAYIFSGTRGIGKTSLARLLAKALRCEHPDAQPGKPKYGTSCNTCQSCSDITKSAALDVLEIDGASNNGVEHIREIRENVKFFPSNGTTKIYIIDEVHMLTGAAFNALLKTLEEPPSHIIFIFATTEIHKVPATILSRCQRFDLKRAPQSLIFQFLQLITEKEKLEADPGALQQIAQKASGSFRDSLSLLDQVIAHSHSMSATSITVKNTQEVLGIVSQELLQEIFHSLVNSNPVAALMRVQDAFESGMSMKSLAIALAEYFRNAVLIKLGVTKNLLTITDEQAATLSKSLGDTQETLQASFEVISKSIPEIAQSPLPKATLEMALIRVSQLGSLTSVAALLDRLEKMEKNTAVHAPVPIETPVPTETSPCPPSSHPLQWAHFVQFALQKQAKVGSLLEHATPVTPIEEWKSQQTLQIGFFQSFYYQQAKARNKELTSLVQEYIGAEKLLVIAKVDRTQKAKPSIVATAQKSHAQKTDKLKEKFLQQKIVHDTKEILNTKMIDFRVKE